MTSRAGPHDHCFTYIFIKSFLYWKLSLPCTLTSDNKVKKYTLDEVKNKFIGEAGTPKRDQYELELKMEILGDLIRDVRKERNLTQTELGELVGVQKAQISKLENNTKNVSLGTLLKVFEALQAKVWVRVEVRDGEVGLG